jgi:hypothetical protein
MRQLRLFEMIVLPLVGLMLWNTGSSPAIAAEPAKKAEKKTSGEVEYPPRFPSGKEMVTFNGPELLKAPDTIHADVAIAKTAPKVDVFYLPGQDYPGNPWSVWGDGIAKDGKYYTAIGDHLAPVGNAYVFEYDSATKKVRKLFEVKDVLKTPEGDYRPGKIHSRIDFGSDGRLYFATHRGSGHTTIDKFGFKGDWILACDPATAETEIIVHGPVPKHCIPNSMVDGQRMIFYGGTAPGGDAEVKEIVFFAYDLKNKKLLYSSPVGPSRAMMLASSTGCVYFTPGEDGKSEGTLMKYDPAKGGSPVELPIKMGLRGASDETAGGKIYAVSQAPAGKDSTLYEFDTKTEKLKVLGPASVGTQNYITTLDIDPTGRYLYYMPGAHGGSEVDGTPIVQYDVKENKKKIIAFLHPLTEEELGVTLKGTFGAALDPAGDKLFVTWNANRGSRAWDSAVVTVIEIPESERKSE